MERLSRRRFRPFFQWLVVSTLIGSPFGAVAVCRAERIDAGGKAYLAQCAVCHGDEGAGNGPLAAGIEAEGKRPPPRLDHDRVTALGVAGVREAVSSGAHRRGATMPIWGLHLGSEWIERIAAYVVASADDPRRHDAVKRYLEAPSGTPPEGRRTYVLYCSGCHGPEGGGDGFLSPTNAKRLAVASLRVPEIARLDARHLERLIGPEGAHAPEAEAMPGWLHTLSPADRKALLGYVRTLGTSR